MPDNITFAERLESIFLSLGFTFDLFAGLSDIEISAAAKGEHIVSGATTEDINNLNAAIAASKNVTMTYRQRVKNDRKDFYTSRVNGLKKVEYVPRTTFQVHTGDVSFMPGNYVVSNPVLWTSLGAYYNSTASTPFGVVGHRQSQTVKEIVKTKNGEEIIASEPLTSISSVANHFGWDVQATRMANIGRGIPLNSDFGKDVIVFPPFYREPNSSFYNGGMEHFMAAFDHKKGRKYFSAISSAPVLQSEKITLGLWGVCKWVDINEDVDCDEWEFVTEHNGKKLVTWNVDGTHYQNESCHKLFDRNHYVQFRTFEPKTVEDVKTTAYKWDENYLLAHEANSNLRILTGFVNNPESDFWIDACDGIEVSDSVDIDALLDNAIDNPHLYTGWANGLACGRKSIQDGEVVFIPGILESYYGALTPILETVDPDKYLVKGIAETPNFNEQCYKAGGETPMVWAWFPEVKGSCAKLTALALSEAMKKFDSNEEFELLIKTDELLDCSAINFPGIGQGSWGYQQMDCLASQRTLAPASLERVKARFKELEAFEIKGVDLPKDKDIQSWVDVLVHLEFETLFGVDLEGGKGWHKAIVKRLKNDSLNGALIDAFEGESWLQTEQGKKAYEETREAMGELIFKGAGVKTLYSVMSPPSRHRSKKLKSQNLDIGMLPIPFFWEKKGHGQMVEAVATRSPVVSMDNPYFGMAKLSKHAKGHICPQKLAFGPLVGDFDGDTSSVIVFTPKAIFDGLKRRNKVIALAQNILCILASEPRVDRLSFNVEDVPKDKAFKSRSLVRDDGTFDWDNVSIEGEQGQMGIYAFAFSHALATGLITPNLIGTQCRYQSAIDLQGSITVNAWSVDASDIIVKDGEVSISDDGWAKAQNYDLDKIQRVLVKDPSKAMTLSNPHWEIATPPFLKKELQDWARSNTFDDMKFFTCYGTSVGDLIVHRDIVLGWRKQWINKSNELVIMTGSGLREINPNSVSLPITNRWLELEKGLKKGSKIRDLAWINKEKSYFEDFDHVVGDYSATHYVWNAIRKSTLGQKKPEAKLFWCPQKDIPAGTMSKVIAEIEEVMLQDVKVSAYTVFLSQETCKVIRKNFLAFVPYFMWSKKQTIFSKFLGSSEIEDAASDELIAFYEKASTKAFWESNQVFDWGPRWLNSACEEIDQLSGHEKTEAEVAVQEKAVKAWTRMLRFVQRLFEMVAVNATNDFCSKWVEIIKDYQPHQSNELYTALVLAHPGVKGLQCPSCRKAFNRHATSEDMDEAKQVFSELHKFLILVDKNIDSLVLSPNAPESLKQIQANRKKRFEEAKGKGELEGFALSRADQLKISRKNRDEIFGLKRVYKRDLTK